MAKNKGKYNSTVNEPEAASALEPSEVVASTWEKAQGSIAPHRNKILLLIGTVIVVLLGAGIYGWMNRKRDIKATAEFQKAMETAQARVVDPELKTPPSNDPRDAETLSFPNQGARDAATLTAIDQLQKDYGSSAVAKHSKLVRAAVLYDMGRFDDSATAYRDVVGLGGALAVIGREGVGLSLEAKALADKDAAARTKGLDAALAEYKLLQPDEKGFYRDAALFHQGRILALKGDKPAAIALFKELTQKFATSAYAREARARLELLEE